MSMSEPTWSQSKGLIATIDDLYPNAVRVGLRLRIEQLSDIDTVSQTYTMRVIQVTDWLASKEDIENFQREKENFTPSRIFKVFVINADEENEQYQTFSQFDFLEEDGTERRYNVRKYFAVVKCTERFECENFPFDVQDLSLVYDTDQGVDRAIFVPSRWGSGTEVMYINKTYLALCDWEIVHRDVSYGIVDWKAARTNGKE